MRPLIAAFVVTVALFPGPNLHAQEPAVQQSINEMVAAWEAGDFETFAGFYHQDTRGFFLDGGLLLQGFNVAALTMAYNAGFRAEMSVRDLDVKSYGEVSVSVAYMDGVLTVPGGGQVEGTWRYSDTRVLQDGEWKIVQYHFSEQAALGR
jgi:ketosteroid isomerase-like protein